MHDPLNREVRRDIDEQVHVVRQNIYVKDVQAEFEGLFPEQALRNPFDLLFEDFSLAPRYPGEVIGQQI